MVPWAHQCGMQFCAAAYELVDLIFLSGKCVLVSFSNSSLFQIFFTPDVKFEKQQIQWKIYISAMETLLKLGRFFDCTSLCTFSAPEELRSIIQEVKYRTGLQSAKLIRQLKRRDRLCHKLQKNYDIITACLQAVSQKRRKNIHFLLCFIS